MIRTQIQLTEEQASALKRLSADRHVSMATLIREAVDQAITGSYRADLRRQAMAVIGKFRDHDNVKDVSKQHDDYLADAFAE